MLLKHFFFYSVAVIRTIGSFIKLPVTRVSTPGCRWKYNLNDNENESICSGSWYIFYVSVRFLSIRYYFHPNAHLVRFSLRFAPVLALLRLTAWISLVGVNDCSTLLSLQIEMESQKNTATNLERISGDYKQMKEENNALAKKLKAAK